MLQLYKKLAGKENVDINTQTNALSSQHKIIECSIFSKSPPSEVEKEVQAAPATIDFTKDDL